MRALVPGWLSALALAGLALPARAQSHGEVPRHSDCRAAAEIQGSGAEVPPGSATIGEIYVRNVDVFDPTDPSEDRWAFRLANRLHWNTRVPVICNELLFAPGDPYDPQRLAETERLLRSKVYLHDVEIHPVAVHDEDGGPPKVDIGVTTQDVWTLAFGVGVGRSGGENTTHLSLRDSNFLGTGQYISLSRDSNVDRTETALAYVDPNLFGRRGRFEASFSENSDGHERELLLARPFYELDAHWGLGVGGSDAVRVDHRYSLGHEFDAFGETRREMSLWGGWSKGLESNGRAVRFLVGFDWFEDRFEEVPDTHAPLPEAREIAYPWFGVELEEDAYKKASNMDQIGRTEDVFLGRKASFRVGFAEGDLGGLLQESLDPTAIVSATAEGGWDLSDATTLLISAAGSGRFGASGTENLRLGTSARLLHRNFRRHLLVASLALDTVRNLDGGEQLLLGGDSGLRGYPLRYQDGNARALFTIEQRIFTDWYPWKLVHVGAAAFADVGRTMGAPAIPGTEQGWLKDIGVGLRLAPSRSGLGAVLHFDVALPLDGDPSISKVQWLVHTKASF